MRQAGTCSSFIPGLVRSVRGRARRAYFASTLRAVSSDEVTSAFDQAGTFIGPDVFCQIGFILGFPEGEIVYEPAQTDSNHRNRDGHRRLSSQRSRPRCLNQEFCCHRWRADMASSDTPPADCCSPASSFRCLEAHRHAMRADAGCYCPPQLERSAMRLGGQRSVGTG
jgi:hypothetical protein